MPRAYALEWALKPMYQQSEASSSNTDAQQLISTPADARPRLLSFRELPGDTVVTGSSDSELKLLRLLITPCLHKCD